MTVESRTVNIILGISLIIFIIMGMISLYLNYTSILNQNEILTNQDNNAESHSLKQEENTLFFKNQTNIIIDQINENNEILDIIRNQTK